MPSMRDRYLKRTPTASFAKRACDILIDAYCNNPEDVEWSEIQQALEAALKAYGLPVDFHEKVFNKETENES